MHDQRSSWLIILLLKAFCNQENLIKYTLSQMLLHVNPHLCRIRLYSKIIKKLFYTAVLEPLGLGTLIWLDIDCARAVELVTPRCQIQEVKNVKYNAASPLTDLISSFFIFVYATYSHKYLPVLGVCFVRWVLPSSNCFSPPESLQTQLYR